MQAVVSFQRRPKALDTSIPGQYISPGDIYKLQQSWIPVLHACGSHASTALRPSAALCGFDAEHKGHRWAIALQDIEQFRIVLSIFKMFAPKKFSAQHEGQPTTKMVRTNPDCFLRVHSYRALVGQQLRMHGRALGTLLNP